MDEIETRVGGLELAFLELAANISPDVVLKAHKSIEAGLAGALDGEDRAQRLYACQLLQDARKRYVDFEEGVRL